MSEAVGKSNNPSRYDIATSLAQEHTPENCVGCHRPLMIGMGLGKQIIAGEITVEQAAVEFKTDMEKCKFGRVVVRGFNDIEIVECSHGQLCGNFVQMAEPTEEHFWQRQHI